MWIYIWKSNSNPFKRKSPQSDCSDDHSFRAKFHAYAYIVCNESALAEAGNSLLMSSEFHRLGGKFGLCAWILSMLLGILGQHSQRRNLAPSRAMKLGPDDVQSSGVESNFGKTLKWNCVIFIWKYYVNTKLSTCQVEFVNGVWGIAW